MVILLSKGSLVYAGLAGQSMMDYFKEQGYDCPLNTNPADFYLDISSIDLRNAKAEGASKERVTKLIRSYSVSNLHLLGFVLLLSFVNLDLLLILQDFKEQERHRVESDSEDSSDTASEITAIDNNNRNDDYGGESSIDWSKVVERIHKERITYSVLLKRSSRNLLRQPGLALSRISQVYW